jgi:tRNA threonylcarbamoyladenosine biosynthesis protein TsaB
MKILAVDTATETCSIAVVDGDTPLSELTLTRDQTHSKHIMEMIDFVLSISGLTVSDIDGFAVTKGPGSFTGLRIGISTVKGLAFASDKPIVGVSTLDALAFQFSLSPYLICPFLDARKGEVYFARYRSVNGILKTEVRQQVLPPESAVCDIKEPTLFVGNGAIIYRNIIQDQVGKFAHFAPISDNIVKAASVALLSMDRFNKGTTDDISTFIPCYIRKSDAEIKKKISIIDNMAYH